MGLVSNKNILFPDIINMGLVSNKNILFPDIINAVLIVEENRKKIKEAVKMWFGNLKNADIGHYKIIDSFPYPAYIHSLIFNGYDEISKKWITAYIQSISEENVISANYYFTGTVSFLKDISLIKSIKIEGVKEILNL